MEFNTTRTTSKDRTIMSRAFLMAGTGFLLIMLIGFITKEVVDASGIVKSELHSLRGSRLNMSIYKSIEGTGEYVRLARLSIASMVLIILSSVLRMVWAFRVSTATKPFIFLAFGAYIAAQGVCFGVLFITWNAIELLGIFGVGGGVFAIMAVIGYFSKDLSPMRPYLIGGSIILFIGSILTIVLYFAGIYSDKLIMIMTLLSLVLFMGFTAYDMWRLKRTSEWAEVHGMDDVMRFRIAAYFGFRLLSDLIAIIWVIVRIYIRKGRR